MQIYMYLYPESTTIVTMYLYVLLRMQKKMSKRKILLWNFSVFLLFILVFILFYFKYFFY